MQVTDARRSLSLPHRALRISRVRRLHAAVGLVVLVAAALAVWHFREAIWTWQMATWVQLGQQLGLDVHAAGTGLAWTQPFLIASFPLMAAVTVAIAGGTYLLFRSRLIPAVKGLWAIIAIPLFLYVLVTWLSGRAPAGALGHTGPEWLYGELFLWCLIALLYALFVFPVPFSLPVKLASLATVLLVSAVWRTVTPVIYMLAAVHSRGVLALPAWMLLGPWADYLYVIPLFSATLAFYKGGSASDYRT